MAEPILKTEARDTGLTTADLANLDEPTSTRGMRQEREQIQGMDEANSERNAPLVAGSATADPGTSGTMSANEDKSRTATAPLFSSEESKTLHARWDAIQVSFVDEPRQAVQQADGLVANAMKRLAEIFAEERDHLDQQWDRGDNVSTEDLRVALRRYRSFFGRLLSV